VNEEKNAARERAIQNNTRGAKNAYKLARTKERRLFRKKQGSTTKKRLNDVRRLFKPQVCRAKNGELLTNKKQELAKLRIEATNTSSRFER
jgi:ribosomal protein L17